MREHKYRGKRRDNGEWAYGYLFKSWERCYILWGTTNRVPDMVEVDPETVGECTNLTDKNSKEIYEGDILYDSGEYYSPVIWSKEYAGWFIQTYDGPEPLYEQGNVIIIGNIYDNPELLKEGD